jgi:hypothetical protein
MVFQSNQAITLRYRSFGLVEGRDAVQNADYLGTSCRRIAYYGSTKHSVWIQVG